MSYKWEIYKDKAGEFRVRFRYNDEIMFSTEGYTSKQSAMNAIESARQNMPKALVVDDTASPAAKTKTQRKRKPSLAALEILAAEAANDEERAENLLLELSLEQAELDRRQREAYKQHIRAIKDRAKAEAALAIAKGEA